MAVLRNLYFPGSLADDVRSGRLTQGHHLAFEWEVAIGTPDDGIVAVMENDDKAGWQPRYQVNRVYGIRKSGRLNVADGYVRVTAIEWNDYRDIAKTLRHLINHVSQCDKPALPLLKGVRDLETARARLADRPVIGPPNTGYAMWTLTFELAEKP